MSVFSLRTTSPKAAPALVSADDAHLGRVAERLAVRRHELTTQLDELRRSAAGLGQYAVERDIQIRRVAAQLRLLERYGVDLCLGRMVGVDGAVTYVGRSGLLDADGAQLLVDWRTEAAAPFFAATLAEPQGLASRRRYRWADGRVVDYWDEAFADDVPGAALDDQSAFIAGLGASRSPRMRDVLATIAADQDAVIRAHARGPLVVDGGPGTGKTVVALHRAAFLMYADARVAQGSGGVLFVGPGRQYLDYADDVLPSLGEDRVAMCTLRDLVVEGASAVEEPNPGVARLKARLDQEPIVDAAVRFYEEPPVEDTELDTPWGALTLTVEDWTEALASHEPGAPHNDARDQVWDALLEAACDQVDPEEVDRDALRAWLEGAEELRDVFGETWPVLDPAELVSDLWSVPAFLRLAAPGLTPDERAALRRDEGAMWTTADLPLLDAARRRIGDPAGPARRRRERAALAVEAEERERVAADLIASDSTEMQVMKMLRGDDLAGALLEPLDRPDVDPLAGPFAHVIVDEAQELTDAQWRMLLARCPSRSLTVVGDRAQAREGFPESWAERLSRVGLGDARVARLTVNYRTPAEVMAVAEAEIRTALPDANVPTSIRETGGRVLRGEPADLPGLLDGWLARHAEGIACVIGADGVTPRERVSVLTPVTAKGLEFDLVVLVRPGQFGGGITGAVDRYVAMTRATGTLALLGAWPLPVR